MLVREPLDMHYLYFTEDGPPQWKICRHSENLAEERLAAEIAEVEATRRSVKAAARSLRGRQCELWSLPDVDPNGRRV